jgi:hypothetical protein
MRPVDSDQLEGLSFFKDAPELHVNTPHLERSLANFVENESNSSSSPSQVVAPSSSSHHHPARPHHMTSDAERLSVSSYEKTFDVIETDEWLSQWVQTVRAVHAHKLSDQFKGQKNCHD